MEELVKHIVTVVVTAGLAAAGAYLATRHRYKLDYEKETRLKDDERNRRAAYLSARTVCVLDPFAMECVDIVHDTGIFIVGGALRVENKVPELKLPTNVDWQSLDLELMYRVLNLPNEIQTANSSISFIFDMVAGPPEYEEGFEERQKQYAKIGLMAMDLAVDLRRKYNLPKPDFSDWDPRDSLVNALKSKDSE